jgi:predicted O-linked N-acetylglucosamine transferase (SPINDLY family)
MHTQTMNWQQIAQAHLEKGEFALAGSVLEQAVEAEPTAIENYLMLGVTYLLLGQEDTAQTTWFCGMAQIEETAIPEWTDHLIRLLELEAQRQTEQTQFETSWLLRQHLKEFAPEHVNNLLKLLMLELQLEKFSPNILSEWDITSTLERSSREQVDQALLMQVLDKLLEFPVDESVKFAKACLPIIESTQALSKLLFFASERITSISKTDSRHFEFAIKLIHLILEIQPPTLHILGTLWSCYRTIFSYAKEVEVAHQFFEICESLPDKFIGSRMLIDAYLRCGKWLEIEPIADQYHHFLEEMVTLEPEKIGLIAVKQLPFNLSLYLKDDLAKNSDLRNKSALAFQRTITRNFSCREILNRPVELDTHRGSSRKLKVGFLSYTLRNHSVGWLSRWLFKYLDPTKFEYSAYLQRMEASNSYFQEWFAPYFSVVRSCTDFIEEAADLIARDQVDILIDLDGTTLDVACCILSLKPAPIQATWLGWDASGLPSIDYFIADPYVLPDTAQEHYREKILRLPQTYIAVEGFESDVPDLKRSDLNISSDAIVYFTSQRALKQHPDVVQAQMQIIKEVPNSYLLIKGGADLSINKDYFVHMADQVGISLDQVRFLGQTTLESIHRANLRIADVILDTFPYNGATTTLEALWMGIPLVTKVGEQFTARYSYAFMKNVGVEEGVAYSDEEYVQWGVRLGTDESLRQQVAWKLRQARHTSPLWNPKQFARDMENAFQYMWHNHISASAI